MIENSIIGIQDSNNNNNENDEDNNLFKSRKTRIICVLICLLLFAFISTLATCSTNKSKKNDNIVDDEWLQVRSVTDIMGRGYEFSMVRIQFYDIVELEYESNFKPEVGQGLFDLRYEGTQISIGSPIESTLRIPNAEKDASYFTKTWGKLRGETYQNNEAQLSDIDADFIYHGATVFIMSWDHEFKLWSAKVDYVDYSYVSIKMDGYNLLMKYYDFELGETERELIGYGGVYREHDDKGNLLSLSTSAYTINYFTPQD